MCDFKPGDELVALNECHGATDGSDGGPTLEVGRVYTCHAVLETYDTCRICHSTLGVRLTEVLNDTYCYCPCALRKVERRADSLTIEAFMTMPGGFEEPRRAPAKKRERA